MRRLWARALGGLILAGLGVLLVTPTGCASAQRAALPVAERAAPRGLFRVPTENRIVVLTIDDAPSSRTNEILGILARHDARATFFVLTDQVDDIGTDALRRAVRQGHEIALHGTRDQKATALGEEGFAAMVREADTALRAIARPAPYFRPGHGAYDPDYMDAPLGAHGYAAPRDDARLYVLASFVPWDAGAATQTGDADRNAVRARRYADSLASGLFPGAIVVFHDGEAGGREARAAATLVSLDRFLERATEQGFRAVTLSEAVGRPSDEPPGARGAGER